MKSTVPSATPDDSASGVGRPGRLNRLVSGPRKIVGLIFPVLQKTSWPRAVMLVGTLVILASVAAVFLAYGLHHVFGVSLSWAILCGIVACIVTLLVNSFCITIVVRNKGFFRALRDASPSIVVAVFIGVMISFTVTTLFFHRPALFEWNSSTATKVMLDLQRIDIENQKKVKERLEEDVKNLTGKNIDEDPVVVSFSASYREAKNDYYIADEVYRCALDILCRARAGDQGISLDELGGKRNRLELSFGSAERNLVDAKRAAKAQIDKDAGDAMKEVGEQQKKIDQLDLDLRKAENNLFEAVVNFLLSPGRGLIIFLTVLIVYVFVHMIPLMLPKDELVAAQETREYLNAYGQ